MNKNVFERLKLPVLGIGKDKENDKDNQGMKALSLKKLLRRQGILIVAMIVLVGVLFFATTTAWYTNVVKTGGLTFETEQWGFEGNVSINHGDLSSIVASPGNSGIIPLSVDNSEQSEDVRIGVTISKIGMSDNLQKRIFFYADAPSTSNGESVAKSYLTSLDAYSYTILAGNILNLNEDYYNGAPIKWEWVYDMLGYYVRATINPTTYEVTVSEYVRPVEYDYQSAIFDTDGNLTYTSSGVSVADFLATLSANDGYAGTIGADQIAVAALNGGYYPVQVDSVTGEGIWIYLCTKDEIEAGIEYDTNEAQDDTPKTVKIVITAQNISTDAQNVTGAQDLITYIANPDVKRVQLQSDLELSEPLEVASEKVIDLNGYELTSTAVGESVISAVGEEEVTIVNGTIINSITHSNPKTATYAVKSVGSDITLSNVNIVTGGGNYQRGICIHDDENSNTKDSTITLQNSTITANGSLGIGVFVFGNGASSDAKTRLILENTTINAGYLGINGNGSNAYYGTEIVAVNSEINGVWGAIYQPQKLSVLNLQNCTLSGFTCLVIKGGTCTITDCTINGTGTGSDLMEPAYNGSGFSDTGDGIYLESTYNWPATITINGENTVVNSASSYAVRLFGFNGYGPGRIVINNGTFTGAKGSTSWNDIGTFVKNGGNFPSDEPASEPESSDTEAPANP